MGLYHCGLADLSPLAAVGAVPFVVKRPEDGVIVRPAATLVKAGSDPLASVYKK